MEVGTVRDELLKFFSYDRDAASNGGPIQIYLPGCRFDYIDPEKQTEYMIALRVLRFRISEDGYENIITNLPPEEFSTDEIKLFYHRHMGNRDIFP